MVISGWKNIANYLGCGMRTAQRWAQFNRLPIHKPAGKPYKAGYVFAFPAELDEWIKQGPPQESLGRIELLAKHHELLLALERTLDRHRKLLRSLESQLTTEAVKTFDSSGLSSSPESCNPLNLTPHAREKEKSTCPQGRTDSQQVNGGSVQEPLKGQVMALKRQVLRVQGRVPS